MFKINMNSQQQQQPGLSYQTNVPLVPKTTKITDEYDISNEVLGFGIVSVTFLHIIKWKNIHTSAYLNFVEWQSSAVYKKERWL